VSKLAAIIAFALCGWGALLLLSVASARFENGVRSAWREFRAAASGNAAIPQKRIVR
jgi:hypothetical protein